MAITYERILRADIARECKSYLADLLEKKSNVKYDFIEEVETTIGSLFMDRMYPFECQLGIISNDYRHIKSLVVKGTIGLWGISIGMIIDFDSDTPIWYTDESLNICNQITTIDI